MIGASPPTATWPILTLRDLRRGIPDDTFYSEKLLADCRMGYFTFTRATDARVCGVRSISLPL